MPLLYADQLAADQREVTQKFREVFGITDDVLAVPGVEDPSAITEEESFEEHEELRERLTQAFWFGIVEPGWAPTNLSRLYDTTPETNYDPIDELLQVMQEKACEELGIPAWATEL